jgi:hypothetical protein
MTPANTDITSDQASPPRHDAFARLVQFGPNTTLAIILGCLALSFYLAGYFVIYWRNADMDFMIVYNALALNDGKPQAFFDHPAYFTILSVKWWFQLMHALGLLDAWSLSSIPSATDVPAFDAAMTGAIRAGRIVAWLTASVFVVVFAALIRHVVRDWRVAMLATTAFAFSGGVAVHMRILRSEMIAACFFTFAFFMLIIVGRRAASWRPLCIGAAAALCVLGMENKIQIILLIAGLPLMILPFGSPASPSTAFWTLPRAWLATAIVILFAAGALYAAWPLIRTGLDPAVASASTLKPLLLGRFGAYQAVLLAWIGLGMIAYAALWRVNVRETLAAMAAVIGGASLGLLALYLQYNPANVVAVINPVEKMLVFADAPVTAATDSGGILAALNLLLIGIKSVLQRYTFVLFTSPRPTVFLVWLILPGIVVAWRRGERQTAIQAALLMLVALGIDSLGVRRGLKTEYFIITDPLIILAGALLLDRLEDLRWSRWTYAIGATLVVVHVAISQAEPVKHVLKKSGPEYICEWNQYYQPDLPMPWCDLPKKR